MTELSGATIVVPSDIVKFGSFGVPLPNNEAKIIDVNDGKILGPNQSGELRIRGPHLMKGHLDNERATHATITADGWLHSGDIAYVNDQESF